jgi:hypothetical protein
MGRRAEGLFFAANSFVAKAVSGLGGLILAFVHFPAHASLAESTRAWFAALPWSTSQPSSSCSCSRWEQSLSIRSLATLTRMLLPSSRLRERGNEVTYGTRYRQDKQWLAEGERLPELPE